jgi:predicted transcriptional regulator
MKLATLLKSDAVKIKILGILSDKEAHSTNELATKCRINAITVHRNCLFLSQLELLDISLDKAKNVRTYQITSEGLRAAKLLAKTRLEDIGTSRGSSCVKRR